jgi:hypothetical protein
MLALPSASSADIEVEEPHLHGVVTIRDIAFPFHPKPFDRRLDKILLMR